MPDKENPLLKKITLPGKRFRLPSRGMFYSDGELDESVVDGEIEVFSMTTIDEITLRSPEFLFTGEAIEKVFNRCIPEAKKPLKLLSQDVDYLLTCLRVVSYGAILQMDLRCPACEKKQIAENENDMDAFLIELQVKATEQEFTLEAALQQPNVVEKMDRIKNKLPQKETFNIDLMGILSNKTVEIDEGNYEKFKFTLNNGQTVELMPLRLDSAVMAYKFQNEDLSKDLTKVEDYITFLLASRIKSINSESSMTFIEEWVRLLPVMLKDELNDNAGKISPWGADFEYHVECSTCNHKRNLDTLLNPINFFTTPSNSEESNS